MVLFSRVQAPDWSGNENPAFEARCRQLPPPVPGEDPFFEDDSAALTVCNGRENQRPCPMRHECLIFSLINHEGSGVWGGMLSHDRMHMKRTWPRRLWQWHPPTPYPVEDSETESCASLAA